MQKFIRKKKYKAREPEETIALIKAILDRCGIKVSEEERYYNGPDVASCRIWISSGDISYGDFGTNGKGMTKEYSLASAYAEFMERIENFLLFGDYVEDAFNKGLVKYMAAPDEVMMDAGTCMREAGDVLAPLLRLSQEDTDEIINNTDNDLSVEKMTAAVPYADMIDNRQVYLPHKTLRMVIGSNGMCAGNTFKEAVIQGLSEIYERAAVREAYLKDPVIKQLHPGSFSGNAIYDKLEKLGSYGYSYKILDLSMGKDYPVIGLLLEKGGKKAFRAGADPCPVTALERCLSEIYQGDAETVERFFKGECCRPFPDLTDKWGRQEVNDEEIAYHVDGSGRTASCIFHPSDEFNEDFRGTQGESDKSDYEYMICLTKELGLGLYIRDWSFLGFPAYHCIIPELSNYDLVYEDGAEIYNWSFEKTVFRNDRFTREIAEITGRMFDIYEKNLPDQDLTGS